MKVLFCTDGSSKSFNAIDNFSKWFNNFEADIVSVSDMAYFTDEMLVSNGKILEKCSNNVNNILNYSQDYFTQKGIKQGKLIKMCGSAVDNILELDESGDYKYIILGSNAKKGIQKWLGSVSQEVASKSKTSVYISKNEQVLKKILFPLDYALLQNSYFKRNISNMNLVDSKISLMSIYQMPDFLFLEGNIDSNWISDVEQKQQRESVNIINSVEKLFIQEGLSIYDKLVTKGNPSEVIIEYIKNNSQSLVAMEISKNKNRVLNNSVIRLVLEHSESDVLINKNI